MKLSGVAHVGGQSIRKLSVNRRGRRPEERTRVGLAGTIQTRAWRFAAANGPASGAKPFKRDGDVSSEIVRRPRQEKYVETVPAAEGRRVPNDELVVVGRLERRIINFPLVFASGPLERTLP